MDKNANSYTVLFASAVCVVLAVALAATYNGLKSQMDANAEFDRQKNVLLAMGLIEKDSSMKRAALEQLYEQRVEGRVLEVRKGMVEREAKRDGEVVTVEEEKVVDLRETEYSAAEIDALRKQEADKPASERRQFVPIYRGTDEGGDTVAWCIPISGYGLWSTLYGYFALEADLRTVRGITFYKHGETAGLGGEVSNPNWQAKWEGKKILGDNGELVGVIVKKGEVNEQVEFEREHMVDGLAGATITSNGVTRFLLADLKTYEPYFEKFRSN